MFEDTPAGVDRPLLIIHGRLGTGRLMLSPGFEELGGEVAGRPNEERAAPRGDVDDFQVEDRFRRPERPHRPVLGVKGAGVIDERSESRLDDLLGKAPRCVDSPGGRSVRAVGEVEAAGRVDDREIPGILAQ